MLTADDIEFEPQQSKIIPLTNSIIIMIAGDSSLQAEIIQNVRIDVYKRISNEPQNWWNISDVANLYARYYNQEKLRRAESKFLAPLGLNVNTFISQQNQMNPKLISDLIYELINFNIGADVETIFAGRDLMGVHIYVAHNDKVSCYDRVGFAAIGAGSRHANSEFMFSGHTGLKSLPETLALTYFAKKRAEVAPGVGEFMDMFLIGAQIGFSTPILEPSILTKLKEIYDKTQDKIKESYIKANQELESHLKTMIERMPGRGQTSSPENTGISLKETK